MSMKWKHQTKRQRKFAKLGPKPFGLPPHVSMTLGSGVWLCKSSFDNATTGMLLVGLDAKLISVNPAFARMLGYSAEQLQANNFLSVTHPDDVAMSRATMQALLDGKQKACRFEKRYLHRNGHVVWADVNTVLMRDKRGDPSHLLTNVQDITNQKLAEQALLESETNYRTLVMGLPDIVMRFDREGRHLFVSDNVHRVTELRPQQFIGKTHAELGFPKDQCVMWEKAIQGVFNERSPFEREFDFAGNAGKIVFNWRLVPELDSQGNVASVLSICRDVTAQRQIESDYRLLFREMLDGIAVHEIICDNQGTPIDYRFLAVNPAFERMTGLKADALVGRTVRDAMPGTENYWIERYGNVALSGEPAYFESYASDLGKHFQVTAFRPAPGQFVCIFVDITERSRAAEQLRASEAKFSEAFHLSPIGLSIAGLQDDRYVEVNEAFTTIFGYTREEAIGRTSVMLGIWPDPARPKFIEKLLTGEPVRNREFHVRHKSGAILTIVGSHAVVDVNGKPCILSTFYDVTDQRHAEAAAKESNERLSFALKKSRTGGWVLNLEDHSALCTPEYDQIFGYTSQVSNWTYERFLDSVIEEDQRHVDHSFQEAIAAHSDWNFECRIRRRDGEIRWIWGAGGPEAGEAGQTCRFAGILQDITRHKLAQEEKSQLEAQLQQAQKLESVGRLAGGVAHDFNNMLGVILGNVDLAIVQVEESEPIYADLIEVRTAAERSAALTEQLLAFARRQPVAPRVLNLNKAVTSMMKMLRRLIGEDVVLKWHPAADLWQVKVDPSQIDQILTNLCVNARDAIVDTGTITIETDNQIVNGTDCAELGALAPGEYVRVTMSDTGCGMDEQTLSHVFEPFFTTKAVGAGTGLGLSMVYGAVAQNNGFVGISSVQGQGTTLSIYLPRYIGCTDVAQQTGIQVQTPSGNETILVVEDEPAMLKAVKRLLEHQGYKVLATRTPSEALLAAKEHAGAIQLLLTDVILPEMNGRDLSDQLLPLSPGTKRLFMSGYTSNVIARHGVLDAGVDFIQKPFTSEDLTLKIREILRGENSSQVAD